MAKKQHVLLVNPKEDPIKWKYRPRKITPKPDAEKDYSQMADRFEESHRVFLADKDARIAARTLTVAAHIDYIYISFFDSFDQKYGRSYLRDFGLEAVKFTTFNKDVLFAVADSEKFESFFEKVKEFVRFGRGEEGVMPDRRMLYINDFRLLSSSKIQKFTTPERIIRFSLIESIYNFNLVNLIENDLTEYLNRTNRTYYFDRTNASLEVIELTEDQAKEIINNFDVVYSATSSLSTVIGPTSFRLPERQYGFTIANSSEDLPLVGIIDTGIDRVTPLTSLITGSIDKTGTDPLIDSENHGTAVAALAALGKRPYRINYRGGVLADAKLLSLKVMITSPSPVPDQHVLTIIREAKQQYPNLKLFVLCINYDQYRFDNQPCSSYAYRLDKLAHELDILIFISTGNNDSASGQRIPYSVDFFENEATNLCSPAESMNNVTVGSNADNLIPGNFYGMASLREFPTLYSRRNCQNQRIHFTQNKVNKHLRKPDILQPGGDFEIVDSYVGTGNRATLEVLSSNPSESFYKHVGTSFSAPLAANLAAQLLKLYPNMNAQALKALLINASSDGMLKAPSKRLQKVLARTSGYGIPNDENVLFSTLNSVTFLLENEIKHKDLIAFSIDLPDYLKSLTKKKGLLKVTATLCFSFEPERDNQLAYCPLFIAYTFFKDKTLEQIKSDYKNSKLRKRWSQDGYAQAKPGLYSNVQKMEFTVNRQEIINEDGRIKVAMHCMVSPQIKATLDQRRIRITEGHKFHLAITITENQPVKKLTNKLYSEIIAINEVDNMGTIDLEADLTLE